jgi:hypothetical protein
MFRRPRKYLDVAVCDVCPRRGAGGLLYCGRDSSPGVLIMLRAANVRALTVPAVLLALAGCAGMSEQACLTSDWRTVGFEDGSLGRSEATIATYRKQCAEHGVQPNLDAYREGHAAGVDVYCRAGNGFEVGHSGAVYQGVCPTNLEPEFLATYKTGYRLYELEAAVRNIDAQIASDNYEQERIRAEITSIAAAMIASETTAEERVLMVSRSAELGRHYAELTNATKSLTQERVFKDRELRDYQQTLAARL